MRNIITNEYRKQIQDATCIEEELYIWNEIINENYKNGLSMSTPDYYDIMLCEPFADKWEIEKGLIGFKDITEKEYETINRVSETKRLDIVKRCPTIIEQIKKPSKEVQVSVCNYDGSLIKYIKRPCQEAQMASSRNVYNLKFIKQPTKEMYKKAFDNLHGRVRKFDNTKLRWDITLFHRELRIIPQLIYKDKHWQNVFYKEVEKYVNKNVIPQCTKGMEGIQKATENEDDKALVFHTLSIAYIGLKISKVISNLLFIVLFKLPSVSFNVWKYLILYWYSSIICGITDDHVALYTRRSGTHLYADYFFDLKKDGYRKCS